MLTVCSVVFNDNQTKLFDYMVRSVLKFTDQEINFIICDNGGNDLSTYKNLPNFKIVSNHNTKFKGSIQHGDSLNKITALAKPPFAIVESDVVVLNKDWYKIPQDKKIMAAKKIKNDDINVYHICLMILNTTEKLDFRPGTGLGTHFEAKVDVGWQIGKKINSKDVQFLKFIDCKEGGTKFIKLQSDEFYYNDTLIAAHFGRGSNLNGKAIKNQYGTHKEQLKKWKEIVDELLKE